MRFALAFAFAVTATLASGQPPPGGQQASTNYVIGTNGAELFFNYCASCHGRDGKGGGPAAVALKFQTPDLTTIARRNKGVFPRERLQQAVSGPEGLFIPAHGDTQMPVWGPLFRALDPSGDAAKRVNQILDYVEFLQLK